VLAGRAAYIAGCLGTSNTLAGFLYGIPVYGTMAHSWVLAFPDEEIAFRRLQSLLGPATVYVVDTYDTLNGVRKAAGLGRPAWGIRLDSGDLAELARQSRAILDSAGLRDAKIMASGDLNELRIRDLVAARAPIDVFGVGTELATSADAPSLGVVYKLVELETDGLRRYTAKLTEDKFTYPGAKQVFRFAEHDEIACAGEIRTPEESKSLLRQVLSSGKLIQALPDATAIRSASSKALEAFPSACRRLDDPEPYPVVYSPAMLAVAAAARRKVEEDQ
jgi:nicotinate phosphoribosyltransferase